MSGAWKRDRGVYTLTTDRGATYYVFRTEDGRDWEVLYPDGEVSEPAATLAEAKAWAVADGGGS